MRPNRRSPRRMIARPAEALPKPASKNLIWRLLGAPRRIEKATIRPLAGITYCARLSTTLAWQPVARGTATHGLAGQVGTASVGAWPTSTIFAEAAVGAAAQAN